MTFELILPDVQDTLDFGAQLGERVATELVYLHGSLGAGKTTLVRGVLRSWGYEGPVKSPTYTLAEEYVIVGKAVYHLDLYRIADPAELDYVGLDELMKTGRLRFVEWPERGGAWLPPPDIEICMEVVAGGRRLWMTDHRELQEEH